jgi:hypothetical protein
MRRSARVAALAAVGAILAGVTCSFPTDQSNQVYVTVTLSQPLVVQGAQITAIARAFRTAPGGPVEIHNVDFEWSVSDSAIAQVQTDTARGAAHVRGLNAGLVRLTARAAMFDKSTPKDSLIRVANALEIDSIRPDSVLYGGKITVYGVGVKNIFLAELGPGVLFADTFSYVGDPKGLGHMDFWVPPPAHTDQFIAFGPGVFAAAPETTKVGDHDIYEPNDTSPSLITLVDPGPTAQLPNRIFFNPALDFEPLDRTATFGLDWYRFGQTDTTKAVTLIFTATGSGRDTTIFNLITDSIYYTGSYFLGDSAWVVGPSSGFFGCKGFAVFIPQASSDSTIVEFGSLTSQQFELFAEYTQEGRYGLRVVRGLVHFDPTVLPDKFSPNEVCNQADDNFANPATTISIEQGVNFFLDTTLTIDFPHAVDWYRFHLSPTAAAELSDTVTIATVSRTPGTLDTSDLDITVLDGNHNFLFQAADSGSTENVQLDLATNADYYVIVSDFAGAPVRYGLCIRVQPTCPALPTPIPAPPGTARGVSRRVRLARARQPAAAVRVAATASRWRIPLRHP